MEGLSTIISILTIGVIFGAFITVGVIDVIKEVRELNK